MLQLEARIVECISPRKCGKSRNPLMMELNIHDSTWSLVEYHLGDFGPTSSTTKGVVVRNAEREGTIMGRGTGTVIDIVPTLGRDGVLDSGARDIIKPSSTIMGLHFAVHKVYVGTVNRGEAARLLKVT